MNLRWGGSIPESGDSGVETQYDHSQSQGPSRQQKMSRQEALVQILEYHREGLARSIGSKNDTDGDGDGDGDERRKRKRRDSDVEQDRHGVGKAYTSSWTTEQQRIFKQPQASSSSSASAGYYWITTYGF